MCCTNKSFITPNWKQDFKVCVKSHNKTLARKKRNYLGISNGHNTTGQETNTLHIWICGIRKEEVHHKLFTYFQKRKTNMASQ